MEYQLHRTVVSDHELVSNGKIYREQKEMMKVIENSNDKSDENTTMIHTRRIENDFYTTVKLGDASPTVETSLKTEEECDNFKNDWTANWKPTLGQNIPKGIFNRLKSFMKLN